MKQSLSLLENAADSLNEALRKVDMGSAYDPRPYKFAVLHFTHAVELLFKHHVAEAHPLLIYKNPFSKQLGKEATIGLWEAIQFFQNEDKKLKPETLEDLKWIKQLRNNIEHYKFEMDPREARLTMGRLIRALNEFHEEHDFTELASLIESDCRHTYDKLANEYKQKLHEAQRAAEEADDMQPQRCLACGELGTMAFETRDLLRCFFCDSTFDMHECIQCSGRFPDLLMSVWNDEHPPHVDWICEGCEDYILSKD